MLKISQPDTEFVTHAPEYCEPFFLGAAKGRRVLKVAMEAFHLYQALNLELLQMVRKSGCRNSGIAADIAHVI